MEGLQGAPAKAWTKSAKKRGEDRFKEMASDGILAEPSWWTQFQRPCWKMAMRLLYGLEVTPRLGIN